MYGRCRITPGILGDIYVNAFHFRRHFHVHLGLIHRESNGSLLGNKNQEFFHSLIYRTAFQKTCVGRCQSLFLCQESTLKVIVHKKLCGIIPVAFCQGGKLKKIIDSFIMILYARLYNINDIWQTEFATIGDYIDVAMEIRPASRQVASKEYRTSNFRLMKL